MATQEPNEDVVQPDAAENLESQELQDEDLKPVSGGLSSSTGSGLASFDTATCVSTY